MTPLQLIVDHLDDYQQACGSLRAPAAGNNVWLHKHWHPLYCEFGYCAEGAICDIFIKFAPEAKVLKAGWFGRAFVWGEDQSETRFLPTPVCEWIDQQHGEGVSAKLRGALATLNDKQHYRLGEIADILAAVFNVPRQQIRGKPASEIFTAALVEGKALLEAQIK